MKDFQTNGKNTLVSIPNEHPLVNTLAQAELYSGKAGGIAEPLGDRKVDYDFQEFLDNAKEVKDRVIGDNEGAQKALEVAKDVGEAVAPVAEAVGDAHGKVIKEPIVDALWGFAAAGRNFALGKVAAVATLGQFLKSGGGASADEQLAGQASNIVHGHGDLVKGLSKDTREALIGNLANITRDAANDVPMLSKYDEIVDTIGEARGWSGKQKELYKTLHAKAIGD